MDFVFVQSHTDTSYFSSLIKKKKERKNRPTLWRDQTLQKPPQNINFVCKVKKKKFVIFS